VRNWLGQERAEQLSGIELVLGGIFLASVRWILLGGCGLSRLADWKSGSLLRVRSWEIAKAKPNECQNALREVVIFAHREGT
jgi:hypothetical protein